MVGKGSLKFRKFAQIRSQMFAEVHSVWFRKSSYNKQVHISSLAGDVWLGVVWIVVMASEGQFWTYHFEWEQYCLMFLFLK